MSKKKSSEKRASGKSWMAAWLRQNRRVTFNAYEIEGTLNRMGAANLAGLLFLITGVMERRLMARLKIEEKHDSIWTTLREVYGD